MIFLFDRQNELNIVSRALNIIESLSSENITNLRKLPNCLV